MSLDVAMSFNACGPIQYSSRVTSESRAIEPSAVIRAIERTNDYLVALPDYLADADMDLFGAMGQRNISGFIGEVFARAFAAAVPGYVVNPHGDGRPDLLDVVSTTSRDYLHQECSHQVRNRSIPAKEKLAPFKYGGIEIKTTVGTPSRTYDREALKSQSGVTEFDVGIPRIDYLSSLKYWGHHKDCESLLGLYYDYLPARRYLPQVVLAMYAEIDPSSDWADVSTGRPGSKKTSNTSLKSSGTQKLYSNPIAVINDAQYLAGLKKIGVNV